MCRLAFLNKEALQSVGTRRLAKFFRYLEAVGGGHGNGVGFAHDGELVVAKGLRLSARKAAKLARSAMPESGLIFHTRLATSGGVSDELCHPFVALDGSIMVAHNGHFYAAREALNVLKLLDERYDRYEYYVHYVPRAWLLRYHGGEAWLAPPDGNAVSDTWVATELLSLLAKRRGAEGAVLRFWERYVGSGNYFVMLPDGTVYLLIGGQSFEIAADGDRVAAASEGLWLLGFRDVLTARYAVVRVRGTEVEVLRGRLEEKREEKGERRGCAACATR